MRFPGIIPAVTTPFAASGAVDAAALAGQRRARCSTPACTASSPPARWARPAASAPRERRDVVAAIAEAAEGRVPVIAGVSAGTAEQAGRATPPTPPTPARSRSCACRRWATAADERRARRLLRARSARATGLPLMALQQPRGQRASTCRAALIAADRRARRAGRRGQGVLGRRAAHPGAAARAPTSRSSSAATTGRSRASAPARPAGSPAWPTSRPRECVALYEHCRAGELDAAREVYRRLLPLARFDMTPKLVQYFKAAMDEVGFAGGPTRAPRLPLDATTERADAARGAGACCGVEVARLRAARYLAAVDSHTEGMPTRVITGGVGPLPGATMLERKLRFEAERDDLRLLLMREPRGHARDVGRDPAAADARRTPTGACSSSRSPAACRCAATGRSASPRCSSRPAWSR